MTTVRLYLHHLQSLALWKTSIGNGKIRLGPVSRKPRKLFGPVKPLQNLEPCDHKAVLFTYSRWREVSFIQEVSGVNTSPFLDTDDLKMALRARKFSAAFEKRAPGPSLLTEYNQQYPVVVSPNFIFLFSYQTPLPQIQTTTKMLTYFKCIKVNKLVIYPQLSQATVMAKRPHRANKWKQEF